MQSQATIQLRRPDGRLWDIEFDFKLKAAGADAFWVKGERKRARALLECSQHIVIDTLELPDGTQFNHLAYREACRDRACVLCQRVVAWKRRRQLFAVLEEYDLAKQRTHPVFIVLTRPAVHYSEMHTELRDGTAALRRFLRAAQVQRAFGSIFRATEFNFNVRTSTTNLHFNFIAMAAPDYFQNSAIYMDQRRDLEPLWRRCCRAEQKCICHIQAIRNDDPEGLQKAVYEAAKYTTKSYLFAERHRHGGITVDADAFVEIHRAIKGHRLSAFTGLFKDLHARIRKREAGEERPSLADSLGARPVASVAWQWSVRKQRLIPAAEVKGRAR